MVELREMVPANMMKNLDDLTECMHSSNDVRVCLSFLVPLAFGFRGLADLAEDPKIRFWSYLITDQLGNVQAAYDGRTSEWYQLNAANISEVRKIVAQYSKIIKESILSNDFQKFIEGTAVFFNDLHPLIRRTTMDTREG